jgi:hypothetical protein
MIRRLGCSYQFTLPEHTFFKLAFYHHATKGIHNQAQLSSGDGVRDHVVLLLPSPNRPDLAYQRTQAITNIAVMFATSEGEFPLLFVPF